MKKMRRASSQSHNISKQRALGQHRNTVNAVKTKNGHSDMANVIGRSAGSKLSVGDLAITDTVRDLDMQEHVESG